jgi:hypothetical protein
LKLTFNAKSLLKRKNIFTQSNFMKFLSTPKSLLYFVICISSSAYTQNSFDSTITKETKFELKNDTLTSMLGLRIYSGQKFILGNGAGLNSRYRSIISKYAALVPNIWGRNNGIENLIENFVDNKKGKKQLEALTPGQVFTFGKINKVGKKEFEFYLTSITSEYKVYRCDILLALQLKELLFQ